VLSDQLVPLLVPSGTNPGNFTEAQLQQIAKAASDGPIFYATVTVIFSTLLGLLLQIAYDEHIQRRSKRGRTTALAIVTCLLCVVMSSIWHNKPLRPDWRAGVIFVGLVVLGGISVAHIRKQDAATHPAGARVESIGSRKTHRSLLRGVKRYSVGFVGGIVIGAVVLIVLGTPWSEGHAFSGASYHVYGTSPGHPGLNERTLPTKHSAPLGQLRDGDSVAVVCQTVGETQTNAQGVSTDIWDKLKAGGYVTDLHVDTPQIGTGIPACQVQPQNTPVTVR